MITQLLKLKLPPGGAEIIWVSSQQPNFSNASISPQIIFRWFYANNGFSAAYGRNLGLSYANGEIIIFLDDDMLVPDDFLLQHHKIHLNADSNIIVRGPRFQIYSDYFEAILHLTHINFDWLSSISYLSRFEAESCQILSDSNRYKYDTNWIYCITANLSIRRQCLPTIYSIFDENFQGASFEDTELCYRLFSSGFRMKLAEKAPGYHIHKPLKDNDVLLKNLKYFESKYSGKADVCHFIQHTLRLINNSRLSKYLYED